MLSTKERQLCRICRERKGEIIQDQYTLKNGTLSVRLVCNKCNTERLKKYRNANRDKIKKIVSKYEKTHKDARNAWVKVVLALRNGVITRPEVCSKCGAKSKVDGHHKDYTKPLQVTWLCRKCHKKEHKDIKKINK